MPPNFPAIVRPASLGRATAVPAVPEPSHHHLPAWVRRAHAQAAPILGDELAALSGETREQFTSAVDDLVARISSGKFSQAFRYQELVTQGERLVAEQRTRNAEQQRQQRALDAARRRVSDRLRADGAKVPPELSARLARALRSANDLEAIASVGAELQQAADSARNVEDRRRGREIDRTRKRIERAVPRGGPAEQSEDWQDVLRRLQEQMQDEGGSGSPLAHPPRSVSAPAE